jgi:TolA-binding protein
MLKPYKRISKKELKEDKFVTFTIKAKDYLESNTRTIMWAVIAVVVVIFLASFYVRSKKQANIAANELLGRALFTLNQGKESEAEQQLKELIDNYDGVSAAGEGCFFLAKYYWQNDDCANAKIYFTKYLDDYGNDDLLAAASHAGYADCLLKDGNSREAAENYEKAARVNKKSPQAPSYLYSAAKTYLELDDLSKVKELASEIIENYEESEYKRRAEILLNTVKYKS